MSNQTRWKVEFMKTQLLKPILYSLSAVTVLMFGPSAFAASTWNLDGCTTASLGGSGCGATGDKVKAAAYSVANGSASNTFSSAILAQSGSSSGLRVAYTGESTTSPQHAMDNKDRTELIAFQFDQSVILDSVTMGWTSSDRDFTLMAYTGAGSPTIVGKTLGGLASGWSLVQNYGDADPSSASPLASSGTNIKTTVNPGNVSSSWWIISAYNVGYGAGFLDNLPDYMKIMTIASRDPTTPPGNGVPEPGSLVLMGAAMMGLVASRRRKPNTA